MNIIVVGFNLNLKKTERETEDISKNKERERMIRTKLMAGKKDFLAGTENKIWREKDVNTNDGQKCIGK